MKHIAYAFLILIVPFAALYGLFVVRGIVVLPPMPTIPPIPPVKAIATSMIAIGWFSGSLGVIPVVFYRAVPQTMAHFIGLCAIGREA